MPWARIDDEFDDHPKVLALLDHEQGGAAVGLWTLCLTWAYRNTLKRGKTPGLIPPGLPRRYLGPVARSLADMLTIAPPGFKEGLWEPLDDGTGWMIHDFEQYLPTEKTREARSEAGKHGAAVRWAGHTPKGKEPGTDGNLLSGDGNLPEPGHEPDSNPMANDGSRAPARRAISKEIAPVPGPVPGPLQQAPLAAANESRPAVPTLTQRSKPITDAYHAAQPMCKWPAINGVVIHALKSGKYSDDEVQAGLLRLAENGLSVTVEHLRIEIEGFTPRATAAVVDRRQAATDQKFDRAMERARARDAQEGRQ